MNDETARKKLAIRSAIAVVLGSSIAASVFFFVQNSNTQDLLTAEREAREAACRYAPVLADYDSKHLDTYFTAVLDGATGDWKKQFSSTSTELRDVLVHGAVTSKVTDTQCAIRTADTESAEAIVVIGQTISSVGTDNKPKPGQLSMVLHLRKVDDKWLVDKLNSPLATPAP
ncbi:hypothetical protein [Nocardia camponoti]|uniref:Mce-associated membrane protein n=1 Tax=Nocardia camponoti TaxID=1616106 RepID=A0A917Q7N2_9NOCA|nr:hypothetical protein [Nocardia camponoti]GGK34054.1 hypothetical protein GCM10011591_02160 [Nocardia camponoti]